MAELYKKLFRKKHVRDDGWLVELVSDAYDDEPFKFHSYLVSFQPDASRAGHYHERKKEWFCIASGRIELMVEDVKSNMREVILLESDSDEYCLVHVKPGVAHLFTNVSSKDNAGLIVFSLTPEDPDDTFKYEF